MLIQTYLALKAGWSFLVDRFFSPIQRKPLPVFATPREVSDYLQRYAVYTGDPLQGAADFYTDPQVFQSAMELGQQIGKEVAFAKLNCHIDCDDYAGYALKACQQIKGCSVRLITLEDISAHFGSHVICAGLWNGGYFAIDTNGYRDLPNWNRETLCKVWNAIYSGRGYNYIDAIESPYPW